MRECFILPDKSDILQFSNFISKKSIQRNILKIVLGILISTAAIFFLLSAAASLGWHYMHDSPIMIYSGFLVSKGMVPYLDFFDMNMPGNYFLTAAIGVLFGWGDFTFRIFDLLCLFVVLVSTYIWMKPYGRASALAAPVIYGLWYILSGPALSLERECIALAPLTISLAIAANDDQRFSLLKIFIIGVLAAVCFLIKPLFPILFLPVLIKFIRKDPIFIIKKIAIFSFGFIITVVPVFLYLLFSGGLIPFAEIISEYWPLYSHLTGYHSPISGIERIIYIIYRSAAGIMHPFTLVALIGIGLTWLNPVTKTSSKYFSGMLIIFAVYPSLSGQFWPHHWVPYYYLALCFSCLTITPVFKNILESVLNKLNNIRYQLLAVWSKIGILFFSILLLYLSFKSFNQLTDPAKINKYEITVKGEVPDQVYQFLKVNMKPGDTVQPLDWAGGAVHGMLMARAMPATKYIYDFHFYHHINESYIQNLRIDFISELEKNRPDFIIQVFSNKPWPVGVNTTRDFPELERYLDRYYSPAVRGKTYNIFQRVEL